MRYVYPNTAARKAKPSFQPQSADSGPSRRWLLRALAAGLVSGIFCNRNTASAAGASPVGETAPRSGAIRKTLNELCSDQAALRDIGRRYLAGHPEDADPGHLWSALFGSSASKDTGDLRHRLIQLRQEDFRSGATELVDGWILARSEAQLCALAALT